MSVSVIFNPAEGFADYSIKIDERGGDSRFAGRRSMKVKEKDVAFCPASRRGTRRGAGQKATAAMAFDPPLYGPDTWVTHVRRHG